MTILNGYPRPPHAPAVPVGRLFDRLPPHSIEAEMALLGSLILDARHLPEARAAVGSDAPFYAEAHNRIFDALRAAAARHRGPHIDGVPVAEVLRERGELDDIGGGDYLVRLTESVPSAVNWPHYARIVEEKHRLRRVSEAAAAILHSVYHTTDPDAACSEALDLVGKAVERSGRLEDVSLRDAAGTIVGQLRDGRTNQKRTGLVKFDNTFGGIPEQRITTVMGVPGSGKSSLVQQIVQGWSFGTEDGIVVFSYEMNPSQIAANMLAQETNIPVGDLLRKGQQPDIHAWGVIDRTMKDYDDANLHFVEDNLNAQAIFDRCVLYRKRRKRVVVVDYIQHLPQLPGCRDETASLKESCRIMRRLARELGMTVIMVSQVTAAAAREDRPPRKSDGVGAGEIEQVSDLMIGVYRESAFKPRTEDEPEAAWHERRTKAQLHVLKNKCGPCGWVGVRFEGALTKFEEVPGE